MIRQRFGIFFTIVALIASVSAGAIMPAHTVYAAPEETTTDDTKPKTNCAVEGFGWAVCTIGRFIAKMIQAAWGLLKSLLYVEPKFFDDDSGTFQAWERMRDFANIAFVLVFLALIYSQITGVGAGSYGWKRMLPRLVMAAVLVNSSYFLCQLLVDLSNVTGFALRDMLQSIADEQAVQAQQANQYAHEFGGANIPILIITGAALGSAAVWILMPILFTVLMTALISVIMTVLLLVLRKAIIVILIFLSPLAFVAYLLPNTEKYAKMWFSWLRTMTLIFPIVSVLFGAGAIVSVVLLSSGFNFPATDDPATVSTAEGNATTPKQQQDLFMAALAILAQVGLLLAAIKLINASADTISGVAGGVAMMRKTVSDRLGGAGKKLDQNSAYNRGKAIRNQAKENYKTQQFAEKLNGGGKSPRAHYTRGAARGLSGAADWALKNRGGVDTIPLVGGSMRAQQVALNRSAIGASIDNQNKDVQNEMLGLKAAANPIAEASKMLAAAAQSGDEIKAKAAQNVLMSSGGPGMDAFARIIGAAEEQAIRAGNDKLVTALKQNALQVHGGTMKEKGGMVAGWAGSQNGTTMTNLQDGKEWKRDATGALTLAETNPFHGLSDSQIATQTSESLKTAQEKNFIDAETAHRILNNTSASENLGGAQRKILKDIAGNYTPPPRT